MRAILDTSDSFWGLISKCIIKATERGSLKEYLYFVRAERDYWYASDGEKEVLKKDVADLAERYPELVPKKLSDKQWR